ncbi:hypothetical protein HDU96_008939, partial [Phlyctochytrium bullatum]
MGTSEWVEIGRYIQGAAASGGAGSNCQLRYEARLDIVLDEGNRENSADVEDGGPWSQKGRNADPKLLWCLEPRVLQLEDRRGEEDRDFGDHVGSADSSVRGPGPDSAGVE